MCSIGSSEYPVGYRFGDRAFVEKCTCMWIRAWMLAVQLNSIMVSGAVPAAAAAGKERRSMGILKGANPVLVTGIALPLITLAFTKIIRDGEKGSYSHRTGPLVTYWGAGRWG